MLALGIVAVLVVLFWMASRAAESLAGYTPFEWERAAAETMALPPPADPRIERYLGGLAASLAAGMELPKGMTISVAYSADPEVNAYATLGGILIVNRGLLAKVPHENALAMVIAHEIAHVAGRHPIRSIARSAGIWSMAALLGGFGGGDLGNLLVEGTGMLTDLSYSREMEEEADERGLWGVRVHYGHAGGAVDLYRLLAREEAEGIALPAMLRTHPHSEDRIARMERIIDQRHYGQEGTTPLPEWLRGELSEGGAGS